MGKEPFKGINPDECVAIGAAIQGGVLEQRSTGHSVVVDVTPLSLGIETHGRLCSPRLLTATPPFRQRNPRYSTTAADNQTSVDVHILQGEREFAKDNKTLGYVQTGWYSCRQCGAFRRLKLPLISTANGIVHVSAKDLGTGKEQTVTITSNY